MNINKDKLVEATIKMLTEENLRYGMYSGLTKGDIAVLTAAEQIKDIPLSDKINLIYYCKDSISYNSTFPIPARIINNVPEEQQKELRIYKPYNYIYSLSQLAEHPELLSILYNDETTRNAIKDYAVTSEEPVYAINKNKATRGTKTPNDDKKSISSDKNSDIKQTNSTMGTKAIDKSEPVKSNITTSFSNMSVGDPSDTFNLLWKTMSSSAKHNLSNIAKSSANADDFRERVIKKGNAGIFQMQGGEELANKFYNALKDYE